MIAPVASVGLARAWSALTVLAVVLGVGTQLVLTAGGSEGYFQEPLHRTLNLFVFFTIQSNLLVGSSALLTALDPDRDTLLRRWLRLTSLVAVTVTGVVYHAVLAALQDLSGWARVADELLHTVVPVLMVLGWVLFGPRRRTGWRVVGLSLVFPVVWLLFTLVRGRLVGGFWPYPFVDVGELGLAQVLLNCGLVAVLFVALAAAAHALDRPLTGRRTPGAAGARRPRHPGPGAAAPTGTPASRPGRAAR